MPSARFSTLLILALMLSALLLVSAGSNRRAPRQRIIASDSFDHEIKAHIKDVAAVYNKVAVDMDQGQIDVLITATDDMPLWAAKWTQAKLLVACHTPSDTGIVACNNNGFPTAISLSDSSASTGANTPSAHLGNLTQLISLSFSGNWISGSLPASWSNLTSLTELSFSDTMPLSGSIPEVWSGMSSLISLRVSFNYVESTVIPIPGWLGILSDLYLRGANFGTQDLPEALFGSISSVVFMNVKWSGNIPATLPLNTALYYLSLNMPVPSSPSGGIPGQGKDFPTDLSGMTSLKTFAFRNHGTSSPFPTKWPAGISSITMVNFPYMTGSIPQSLFDTPSLSTFTMNRFPQVTGSFPGPSSPSASNMVSIAVYTVGMSGPVSSAWFFIPSLTTFIVESNSGTLEPFELGALPTVESGLCKIVTLSLVQTQLSGSLPDAFFSICPDLVEVDLSDNKLQGPLPSNWSQAKGKLSSLSLYSNRFSGSIPSGIKWLPGGNPVFDLYDNALSGTLPIGFFATPFSYLDLESNDINVCSNIDNIASSGMQTCYFSQRSNNNWCPCSSNWTDIGCSSFGDCAVPSQGPPPLSALPPYTPSQPLPPAFYPAPTSPSSPASPSAPSTPSSTGTPSSGPSTLGPRAPTPGANVPTGAASSASNGFAALFACLALLALFML